MNGPKFKTSNPRRIKGGRGAREIEVGRPWRTMEVHGDLPAVVALLPPVANVALVPGNARAGKPRRHRRRSARATVGACRGVVRDGASDCRVPVCNHRVWNVVVE